MAQVHTTNLVKSSGNGSRLTFIITLYQSDPTDTGASDVILFDNSAYFNDVSTGVLQRISCLSLPYGAGSLKWDATTPFLITSWPTVPAAGGTEFDYRSLGGLKNPGGAGATGDLILSIPDKATYVAGDNATDPPQSYNQIYITTFILEVSKY